MNIFITGYNGFVGRYIINYFKNYKFHKYNRNNPIYIDQDVVFHFAGKAHDLKNVINVDTYYNVNTELTKKVFDSFLLSNAKVFITLSSVKAATDKLNVPLNEEFAPNPSTHYGKSKLLAEKYILSKKISQDKRVYILRPCMIHGPGNKGNLNLLYNIVRKGIPWPLGSFDNNRSFCSIENLCFIINELIENDKIPSGIYNVADDDPLSTNQIIELISISLNKKKSILKIPKSFINLLAKLGDYLRLPLNTERLEKLTENYIVSNSKIKKAISKSLQ